MTKVIKIRYTTEETGLAEYLGDQIARIVGEPYQDKEVRHGDIVQLDRPPDECAGLPGITRVLFSKYEACCDVFFPSPAVAYTLQAVLAIVGAECQVLMPPCVSAPGLMRVRHPKGIDPGALANAIGIEQSPDTARVGS